jgi:hypothetical protein
VVQSPQDKFKQDLLDFAKASSRKVAAGVRLLPFSSLAASAIENT